MARQTAKEKHTALYCRLSKDDGNLGESSSIQSQKEMLTRYARDHGFQNISIYVDDGYSGTNFNRPDFQRLISDIENGEISTLITKDLSRLGRNYLETGVYLEIFFPEHGVRFIAINDGVDSDESESVDFTPFRNIINELYAKDTSKKTKTAKRARVMSGMFIGSSAPYGYMKDPDDRHRLIIDKRYAPVVRKIFDLAKNGMGAAKISNYLNTQHILRPAIVNENNFDRFFDGEDDEKRYYWHSTTVRGILRNPIYAGNLVMDKRPTLSFKSKKRLRVLPENYTIVPNTHEPIVDPEDFEVIQRMITSRRLEPRADRMTNIFAGLIKCADCGKSMILTRTHRSAKGREPLDLYIYMCNNYRSSGRKECSMHWLEARDLYEMVLDDIRKHAKEALKDDKGMADRLINQMGADKKTQDKAVKKELSNKRSRLAEVDRLFAKLYEDMANDKITERNYQMMCHKYEAEQTDLQARIDEIESQMDEKAETSDNIQRYTHLIKEYAGIKELDAALLNRMIEKITVTEPKEVDGEKVQEIKIYYKFIGNIS